MLAVLERAERALPEMLREKVLWSSLFVSYHLPFVERLYCTWGEYRLYLHRIHPCLSHEALFHPHPWPSAMRVLSGTYEMAMGYGKGDVAPPIATKVTLLPGCTYEMSDPDAWHYVRPLDGPTFSFMVTGKPWERSSPKSNKPPQKLSSQQVKEIFQFFRMQYPKPR